MAKSSKKNETGKQRVLPQNPKSNPKSKTPPRKVVKPETSVDLEKYLLDVAVRKHAMLNDCQEGQNDGCTCNTHSDNSRTPTKVDLIILIDTSGSMRPKAVAISNAADLAIERAKKSCNVDLQPYWLGINDTIPGTKFEKITNTDFLNKNECPPGIAEPHPEEGADTITDLCRCPKIWRKDACRAIFYISDEPLNLGEPQNAEDTAAAQVAIEAAKENQVHIFAHLAPGGFDDNPETLADYSALCGQTGGQLFAGSPATEEIYEGLLEQVICRACGTCTELDLPAVSPCFSVAWGDSDCDCMETDDFEILLIKACNCYTNITFHDLRIGKLTITDANGDSVSNLPDGTPSVEILPAGPICFDELAACRDNQPNCKAREILLQTRGAIPGDYQLKLGDISFSVINSFSSEKCFTLSLCKD